MQKENLFSCSAFFILLLVFYFLAAGMEVGEKSKRNYYECNKVHGGLILGWHSHIVPYEKK